MTETPVALTVVLALGTVAALVLAVLLGRERQRTRQWRSRVTILEADQTNHARYNADLETRMKAAEAEVAHLVNRVSDAAAAVRRSDVKVRGPLARVVEPELDAHLNAVLDQVREVVKQEWLRVDFAAQAAMRGATTTIQALLYQLQTLLQQMQEKYDDPQVAEDLLAADFLNEQVLRRIQSTAVVCGAWPGLARNNSHLADVVVGAMSRLSGYERVQISNQLRDPVGVVARAAEPVAIVLTELIGNALHYSHPELPVSVTLQQGNRGASVVIDDAGVGMHEDELTRAKRLLSGEERIMLTELGDPPRNGFAAIGRLVQQYGFFVHVEPSPYGGVRAVVHIPGDPLLTLMDEEAAPQSAMAPLPSSPLHRRPAGPAALPDEVPSAHPAPASVVARRNAERRAAAERAVEERADSIIRPAPEEDLPRRRRRRPAPSGAETAAPAAPVTGNQGWATAPSSSPEEAASRWMAFQHGTASGRAAVDGSEGLPQPGGATEDARPGTAHGPGARTPADGGGAGTAGPRTGPGPADHADDRN
jgi:signal transduction histidine kinase